MDSENRNQIFLAFLQNVEGLDAPKSIDDIYFIELENVLIGFKETKVCIFKIDSLMFRDSYIITITVYVGALTLTFYLCGRSSDASAQIKAKKQNKTNLQKD